MKELFRPQIESPELKHSKSPVSNLRQKFGLPVLAAVSMLGSAEAQQVATKINQDPTLLAQLSPEQKQSLEKISELTDGHKQINVGYTDPVLKDLKLINGELPAGTVGIINNTDQYGYVENGKLIQKGMPGYNANKAKAPWNSFTKPVVVLPYQNNPSLRLTQTQLVKVGADVYVQAQVANMMGEVNGIKRGPEGQELPIQSEYYVILGKASNLPNIYINLNKSYESEKGKVVSSILVAEKWNSVNKTLNQMIGILPLAQNASKPFLSGSKQQNTFLNAMYSAFSDKRIVIGQATVGGKTKLVPAGGLCAAGAYTFNLFKGAELSGGGIVGKRDQTHREGQIYFTNPLDPILNNQVGAGDATVYAFGKNDPRNLDVRASSNTKSNYYLYADANYTKFDTLKPGEDSTNVSKSMMQMYFELRKDSPNPNAANVGTQLNQQINNFIQDFAGMRRK